MREQNGRGLHQRSEYWSRSVFRRSPAVHSVRQPRHFSDVPASACADSLVAGEMEMDDDETVTIRVAPPESIAFFKTLSYPTSGRRQLRDGSHVQLLLELPDLDKAWVRDRLVECQQMAPPCASGTSGSRSTPPLKRSRTQRVRQKALRLMRASLELAASS